MSRGASSGGFGANPLLSPCLNGLGKFSHLIDLDFMGDLMNSLKNLASGGTDLGSTPENGLTVSERLRCCIVAFKVMRSNLDALNVDLHEFFIQLYNLMLEYRPDRLVPGNIVMGQIFNVFSYSLFIGSINIHKNMITTVLILLQLEFHKHSHIMEQGCPIVFRIFSAVIGTFLSATVL